MSRIFILHLFRTNIRSSINSNNSPNKYYLISGISNNLFTKSRGLTDPNLYGFLSHSFTTMTAHFDARFDGLSTYVESSLEEMSDRMEELALSRNDGFARDGDDDGIGPS